MSHVQMLYTFKSLHVGSRAVDWTALRPLTGSLTSDELHEPTGNTHREPATWLPDYLFTARRVHAAAAAAVHGLEMLTLVYPHHCAAASGNSIACICISPSRGGGSKEPAATHANARTLW